jgi:predicted Fe-Mo cluster-binding NifX family protein
MKIAIATDDNMVSAHFGRCPEYTIFEVTDDCKITASKKVANPGHQPGAIPDFLSSLGATHVICGGMGRRAQDLFDQKNIKTILGIEGNVPDVINEFLKGTVISGQSLCKEGSGKGYGIDKEVCDHQ